MRRSLALTALLACTLPALDAAAVTWHRPSVAGQVAPTAKPAQIARSFIAAERKQLKLTGVELSVHRELQLGAVVTVRFRQEYRGVPVLNSAVALRMRGGAVERAVVDVARDLSVDTTPALSQAAALEQAAKYQARTSIAPPEFLLAVLRDDSSGGRLVWQVDIPTADGGWRYLIDAHDGTLRGGGPRSRSAQGRVYLQDPVTTPTLSDVELVDLVAASPQHLNGAQGNLQVTNYVSGDPNQGQIVVQQTLEPNSGEDFLYDPPVVATDATDGFAQVNLYYHLTRMKAFYETQLGVDMSPASWKLVAVANLLENGSPMDNAFFSPQGINSGAFRAPNMIGIGQGTVVDFALDSDVFLHEFTHYVSDNAIGYNGGQTATSEYGLSPWGGSIDEGISDYFACTENGNPTLGETSLGALGAERNLADTSKICPRDMIGEVHADGELIGSLGWSLREEFGKSVADRLVWGAASLLTTSSTLGDFGRGLKQTAADLEQAGDLTAADLTTIDALVTSRGLDECDNELTVTEGTTVASNMLGLTDVGRLLGGTCSDAKDFITLTSLFHFKTTPTPEAKALRFRVDLFPQGGGGLDWGIYVRRDQHVGMSSQGFIPTVNRYDHAVEHLDARSGEIVIDENSDPPFDPNVTYYMVLSHQNCPVSSPEVSVENLSETPVGGAGGSGGSAGSAGTGGAAGSPNGGTAGSAGAGGTAGSAGVAGAGGADEGDADDSGCGCSVPGQDRAPLGSALAFLGALGFLVRRRRHV